MKYKKPQTSKTKSGKDEDAIRLNKYIANSGKCSRRDADLYISSGNVMVNGKVVNELGYKVKPGDEVRFDGVLIKPEKKVYVLINKPKGVSTDNDTTEKNIYYLTRKASPHALKASGRLHKQASGLVLLTNDDEMLGKIKQHNFKIEKLYHVVLDKKIRQEEVEKIRNGIKLEDGFIKPAEVEFVENAPATELGLKLSSAKNTVIYRLFEKLNYTVLKLDRVMYAGLTKKDLDRGRWRYLTAQEIINLKNLL